MSAQLFQPNTSIHWEITLFFQVFVVVSSVKEPRMESCRSEFSLNSVDRMVPNNGRNTCHSCSNIACNVFRLP